MSASIAPDMIRRIETLPPLPAVVPALLRATADERAAAEDVANVLRNDAAVAAKILRVANSPFYGHDADVTDLSRAVVRLGVIAVRNLVIGLCSRCALRPIGKARSAHDLLWYHSAAAAAASDLIARRVGYAAPEEAFIAGLLHDIGQLTMIIFQPGSFHEMLTQPARPGQRFLSRERERFGLDHTEAGQAILTHWGLPPMLVEVAAKHHTTDFDPGSDRLLMIAVLGDTLAQQFGMGFDFTAGQSTRGQRAAHCLGLSGSDCVALASELPRRLHDADQLLQAADQVQSLQAQNPNTVIHWVDPENREPHSLARMTLEFEGWTIQPCPLDEVDAPESGLLLFAHAQDDRPSPRPAIVLTDDGNARCYDAHTRRCHIPREFNAFDFRWAQEKLCP